MFHVSLFRPVVPGPLDHGEVEHTMPAAVEVEGTPRFRVHCLLNSRVRHDLQFILMLFCDLLY